MGREGKAYLLDTNVSHPVKDRLIEGSGIPDRPNCVGTKSEQSSAFPLGEQLGVIGGCFGDTRHMLDVYNAFDGTWKSFDTALARGVPASILLADGTVLFLSGENYELNQIAHKTKVGSRDPRVPQVFDPETGIISYQMGGALDVFRGYHNMAALLPDGTVVVGGGFEQKGDVGCENPNIRIFQPSYLFKGPRPVIMSVDGNAVNIIIHHGTTLEIQFSGVQSLHPVKPVGLLAVQAFTHSYGQNQRYVRLPHFEMQNGTIKCDVPASSKHLLPGWYHLFLISSNGVPSIALPVHIPLLLENAPDNAKTWIPWAASLAAILGAIAIYDIGKRRGKRTVLLQGKLEDASVEVYIGKGDEVASPKKAM